MKKIFIAAFLFLLTISVHAQNTSVAFGPIIGFAKGADTEGSVTYSGALRINLGGFGVEGSIGYQSDSYNENGLTTKSYPIMLTGQLNLISVLYGQAGIGWYNTKIDFKNPLTNVTRNETQNTVGYHAGFGAQLDMGSYILTGDIKYIFLDLELDSLLGLKDAKSSYSLMSVGILLKL